MCSCGCDGNAERLRFPGPNGSTYVLSLYPGCEDCHVGSAVRIERYVKGSRHASDIEEFSPESLEFIGGPQWPNDGEVVISCGYDKHEFVKATKAHIEGIGKEMFGDSGTIDDIGAETILEEMYPDACYPPRIEGGKRNE